MNSENMKNIERIKEILHSSKYAVFFGGAGVSTDSGIPDFRGNGGLYENREQSNEYYLSKECMMEEPERFFEFFRKNMLFENAEPNLAHIALCKLEKQGILKSVITQNIDGLHQRAGSKRVIELHGTATRYYCTECRRVYSPDVLLAGENIPRCTVCEGIVRPDVTLYGESPDGFNFYDAAQEISKADVLIAGGSSLVVNPAASLINSFSGKHLIIINRSSTPYDASAEYVIHDSLSDVLGLLAE